MPLLKMPGRYSTLSDHLLHRPQDDSAVQTLGRHARTPPLLLRLVPPYFFLQFGLVTDRIKRGEESSQKPRKKQEKRGGYRTISQREK